MVRVLLYAVGAVCFGPPVLFSHRDSDILRFRRDFTLSLQNLISDLP